MTVDEGEATAPQCSKTTSLHEWEGMERKADAFLFSLLSMCSLVIFISTSW